MRLCIAVQVRLSQTSGASSIATALSIAESRFAHAGFGHFLLTAAALLGVPHDGQGSASFDTGECRRPLWSCPRRARDLRSSGQQLGDVIGTTVSMSPNSDEHGLCRDLH